MNKPAILAGVLLVTLCAQVAHRVAGSGSPREPVTLRRIGEVVPMLDVSPLESRQRVSARPATLNVLASPSCAVLYFFDPMCAACAESAEQWKAHAKAGRMTLAVTWIAVGGNARESTAFLNRNELAGQGYMLDAADMPQLGIGGVPTVWVAAGGRIEKILQGVRDTGPTEAHTWCS